MAYIETTSGPAVRPPGTSGSPTPSGESGDGDGAVAVTVIADGAAANADAKASPTTTTTTEPKHNGRITHIIAGATKLASFAPLGVLPALRDTHAVAALAACVAISLAALAATFVLKRRAAIVVAPKRIDVASLAIYAAMLVAACFKEPEVGDWASAAQNAGLFLFMLATMVPWGFPGRGAKAHPFTDDWARDDTPPEAWGTPLFRRTCDSIAWVWTVAMGLMAVGATAMAARPDWRPDSKKPWQFFVFGIVLGFLPLFVAIVGQQLIVRWANKQAAVLQAEREAKKEAEAAVVAAAAAGDAPAGADAV